MITVIVQFQLSAEFTPEIARGAFREAASKFFKIPGLIRKYFLLSQDGSTAASVYLWDALQPAQEFFSEAWKDFIQEKYGYRPTVTYYECAVVVDNRSGEVITDKP